VDGSELLSITSKSRYALSALIELHRIGDGGPVPVAELARRGQIPLQFLEQLLATLRRAGVLRSQRGVKGGYSFARSATEVTVLEVVEFLDGPLGAQASGVFADAARAATAVLRDCTVAEAAEREARVEGQAMYFI
jgi:Rrf2 family protein